MSGRVLIAPDKFKGSLSASEVAEAVAGGVRRVRPAADIRCLPVADGGEGTVQAAVACGWRRVPVLVGGPLGAPLHTEFAIDGDTALVELASASGLQQLPAGTSAPLTSSSAGTGELIRAALDAGARTVVLGVGGSACTDGGAGMLGALGAGVLDASGRVLPPGGGSLSDVSTVELAGLDPRLADTTVILASDVDNPLLGPRGAARVYGPQKGASPEDVQALQAGLGSWSDAVSRAGGRDTADSAGAGAAGGVGYAALAVLGATQRPGVDVVLELVRFRDALDGARLVVTGEGAVDEQTVHGKAPAGVARCARESGVPVVAVAGQCSLPRARLSEAGFDAAYVLAELEQDPQRCLRDAARLLDRLGAALAHDWLPEAEGVTEVLAADS
ncbi:glycerate kinase [Allosaccharopolyspora coralli]|uniref:Glycerate kinase n=1 Tax=Allosaccharopolyspora coralli TaxID=2665642 RepID=A0A5Q3QAB4_9PSEU|nr:glycerate kinase [Allosaccharopolyspora coralli]QGK70134.1 glycerate kinase [Allosaccharopolyspora coralli]